MPANDAPPRRQFWICTGELVDESKIWKFPNAHIVGELRLRFDRGINRHAAYLAYYIESKPTDEVPLIYPFVGVLVPYSPKVCCTLCERVSKWEINQSTLDALMCHLGMTKLEEG